MGKIIGIDLGTTNSVVAIMEGTEPTIIANSQGSRLTPSVISFNENGERLLGTLAKRQAAQNPKNTVHSIKRFMGRRHNEIKEEEKTVPYQIVGGTTDLVKVRIHGKDYTPPELSAMILQDLKKTAEDFLNEKVTEAVITVPAYFNDAQRQATKDAGAIAGLNVLRILNEPTAAALAYGLGKKKDQTIAVFDLGGGTFDISILEVSEIDGELIFEVKATNGDTHLGGDDFDETITNYLVEEFKAQYKLDLRKDAMALQRLKEAAEKAKCELSTMVATSISLPFITQDANKNPIHFNFNLTKAKFEQLCDNLFNRLYAPCRNCIKDSKIDLTKLDEVILVGGSSRIPKVQQTAKEIFGKELNRSVNPDEAVAAGAAVQASILNKTTTNITFIDVTPLSLGVEVERGIMAVMIPRNTSIPTEKKETFSTAADMQPAVDIYVFQGERKIARENRLLGHFKLDGIPMAHRGVPKIEVSFNIDQNGILQVSAKDLGTNKEQKIVIESSSGITEAEIRKMKEEAEKYAADDEKKVKEAEELNQAEHLRYNVEKMLKENGDKLTVDVKEKLEKAVTDLTAAIKSQKVEDIQTKKKEVEEAVSAAAQQIYSAVGDKNQTTPTN